MKNVYLQLIDELDKDKSLVIGTLVKTKGSTPQIPGASAIFNREGLLYGTLGGGILEAETLKRAKTAIQNGENIFEEFNLNAGIDEKSGAICGGTATFILDANPIESLPVFQKIKKSLESRIPGFLVTVIKLSVKECNLSRFWFEENNNLLNDLLSKYGVETNEISPISRMRNAQIFKVESKNIQIFVEPVFPKPELIIVGAGHIGQELCHLGNLIDFDVTVLDGRPELATK